MSTNNSVNVRLSGSTGTGNFVGATSPTLITPIIGVATATTVNKVTITSPATSATLTIADGKTLTQSNTLTYTGVDGSSVNFGAGGTVSYAASSGFTTVNIQTFTGSGTYTPTASMKYCIIELVGGGGGGGGISSAGGITSAAGPGGAGGYAMNSFSAATIGVSQTVTIGAAGAAGASGNNAGGSGGTTSVGALISATGGGAGSGSAGSGVADFGAAPGSGGSGSGGAVNINGGKGSYGSKLNGHGFGGTGGASMLGKGGASSIDATGVVGVGYGSGGSGACGSGGTSNAGAAGTAGIVIVTEFI